PYHFIMYSDSPWNVVLAPLVGLPAQFASIDLMLPYPPNARYDRVDRGAVVTASVSRFGERIITTMFTATKQVDPTTITEFGQLTLGMRYYRDLTIGAGGKPLVHDLVNLVTEEATSGKEGKTTGEAWSGSATIAFGESDVDELHHLEPKRMLESY